MLTKKYYIVVTTIAILLVAGFCEIMTLGCKEAIRRLKTTAAIVAEDQGGQKIQPLPLAYNASASANSAAETEEIKDTDDVAENDALAKINDIEEAEITDTEAEEATDAETGETEVEESAVAAAFNDRDWELKRLSYKHPDGTVELLFDHDLDAAFATMSESDYPDWPAEALFMLSPIDEEGNLERIEADIDGTGYEEIIIRAAMAGNYEVGEFAVDARNRELNTRGLSGREIDFHTLFQVAKLITAEAGGYKLDSTWRMMIGEVLVNRLESPEFPEDIDSVLYQPGQYYSADNQFFANLLPNEDSTRCAYRLLNGERVINDPTVVFHANIVQGGGVAVTLYDDFYGYCYLCYTSYPDAYKAPADESQEFIAAAV